MTNPKQRKRGYYWVWQRKWSEWRIGRYAFDPTMDMWLWNVEGDTLCTSEFDLIGDEPLAGPRRTVLTT